MKKFKLFLSFDNEETWINTIQENGYKLTHINLFFHIYTFNKTNNSNLYTPYVRLDVRKGGMNKTDYANYVTLFDDSGWRLIKGGRYGGIQYFQQKNSDVSRNIFSDQESKDNMKKRYVNFGYMQGFLLLFYIYILFPNMFSELGNIFNVKSWYLTPGLWEMSGSLFWKAIIFETPFVLLRMLPIFIFLFFGIYSILRAITNDESLKSRSK